MARSYLNAVGFVGAAAVVALVAQPAIAASVEIVDVRLQRGDRDFQLVLRTVTGNERPQILTVNQGNQLIAELVDTQLNINGNRAGFRTENPIPGIAAIELVASGPNTVRVIVTGTDAPPVGQVLQRQADQVVLGFTSAANAGDRAAVRQPANAPLPPPMRPEANDQGVDIQVLPPPGPNAPSPTTTASPVAPPPSGEQSPLFQLDPSLFAQSTPRSDVLVPNPEITIDGGRPAPAAFPAQPVSPAPPFLPRAVAPPVGDIAVATMNVQPEYIDLGTTQPISLRMEEAQADTVLGLLARSAGLNLIFTNAAADGANSAGSPESSTVSLDLEGESIQNAFNYVLQVAGLEAQRRGRTIFVGRRLPEGAKDYVSRTFRLNQATAETVANYLATQGAEVQLVTQTRREIRDPETGRLLEVVFDSPAISSVRPTLDNAANLPLRRLAVSSDERMNTITVSGAAEKVTLASQIIQQLDARLRQVIVNVKIIDVNLQNIGRFGTSFSFGLGDTGIINQSGVAIINFGTDDTNVIPSLQGSGQRAPVSTDITGDTVGSTTIGTIGSRSFNVINEFLAQLQASIQNNNAKILTDPSLVIQEGQTAEVSLTQEVVTDVTVERDVSDGLVTVSTTTEKGEVGLKLAVNVSRIDDNGFVSLSLAPEVTSIGNTQTVNTAEGSNVIALLNTRQLGSGLIRMRDGQTLILSGIIQDQDRVNTQKIPILGDLPIIGSLFRSTSRTNERREVVILVTPQILDDSMQSTPTGYTYTPNYDTQQMLQQQGIGSPSPSPR
ncbi:secretin N-terminal domain-containing protein [Spirulina sp. CCNP1310]|uniref:secretin N-terminal domain-containing protein n=1 Tax=Spirulina sp. CCNP1310 TaxID=3110249 RepID=UPI002B1EDB98|nr:secretin N-terminal domain-containing protein [Spirulina sp. CCNP1310]MEA5420913.1 secretin N-terminal domain-containing protein [Spirulina sp. CCNP1310]